MMNDEWRTGVNEKADDLRFRTRKFAVSVVRLFVSLPKTTEAQVLGKQMLRSGTSVGAHYREAARAKSDADFISKLEGALQELDETSYWLELLIDADILAEERARPFLTEIHQLLSIFVASVKTVKSRANRP
jgi:four helix bundle protein